MAGKEVECSSSSSSSTISKHAPIDFIKDLEEAREKGLDHFAHQHRLEFKETIRSEEEEARDKGLEHFPRKHRLKFMEEMNDVQYMILCMVCDLEIKESGFSCNIGEHISSFDLHQQCAFLPIEIPNYPNHDSQHILTLSYDDPMTKKTKYWVNECSVCHKLIFGNFRYRCNMCSFGLHVRCAAMGILVFGNHHLHPLTPMLYPALFDCSLCGQRKEEMDVYYTCKTCPFLIHQECYAPPTTIQHGSHVHPLRITYQATADLGIHGEERYDPCAVCKDLVPHGRTMMYSCSKCKYHLHLQCSKKKWEKIPIRTHEGIGQLIEFPMPTAESVNDILSHFIKQKCEWKVEDKIEPLLKHACHEHPLVLVEFNNLTVSNRSCNACSLFLSDGSFYSCTKICCNFVLHKWCAKLPLEMEHPAHPRHILLLHVRGNEDKSLGFFTCTGCGQRGNGFMYKCRDCYYASSFYLDVRCACFPSFVKHETHEHPLFLNYEEPADLVINDIGITLSLRYCNSCGGNTSSALLFSCDACTFSIDIGCLLLPREITHWYNCQHGFKLTYDLPQCEQGYYCELCEQDLDPNHWIYHCFECDWSLDTTCVRKAFNIFKGSFVVGGSQDYEFHVHPLTCVLVPREWCRSCYKCSADIYEKDCHGFSCSECKIVFCMECVWRSDSKSNPFDNIVPEIELAEEIVSDIEDGNLMLPESEIGRWPPV